MMAKQKDDTSNSILSSIDELLKRKPPRAKGHSEKNNLRLIEEAQQSNEDSPHKEETRQQQLEKDFPVAKMLQANHPSPSTRKIPTSILSKKTADKTPKKTTEQSTAQVESKVRILTQDMLVETDSKNDWRGKLSLLALEKEEIRLLMHEVKKDVAKKIPESIPLLVETFLNQRLDDILARRPLSEK